jgi:hypothetical protein
MDDEGLHRPAQMQRTARGLLAQQRLPPRPPTTDHSSAALTLIETYCSFESGGRGFESLRARQHLGQILDRPKLARLNTWVTTTKESEACAYPWLITAAYLARANICIPNAEKLSNPYILNSSY